MAGIPIHTSSFKGIGKITVAEIEERFGSAAADFEAHRVGDWDINRFSFTGQPESLIQLGTVEDVFYSLVLQPLEGAKADLPELRSAIRSEAVSAGLAPYWSCSPRRRVKSRLTYRVVVQARDAAWRSYRRGDVQKAVAQAIKYGFPKWRRVEEDQGDPFGKGRKHIIKGRLVLKKTINWELLPDPPPADADRRDRDQWRGENVIGRVLHRVIGRGGDDRL